MRGLGAQPGMRLPVESETGVDKVRVIHVTSRLNVGGLAQLVITLAQGLDGDGFECILAAGKTEASEGNLLEFRPAPGRLEFIPELGRSVRPMADFAAFWKLYRLFRAFRPQVVHTHAAKAGALGRLAALLAGVPVRVHSFHGHVFHGYFGPAVSAAVVWVERLLGLLTTVVVLPCESQRREIAGDYRVVPSKKASVVHYGIPVDSFAALPGRDEARAELGVPREALAVGAIGRIAPVKNHALLLDAFARLPELVNGRPTHLLVVGGGELRAEAEARARQLGLSGRVTFRPWLKDLRWAYAALDVLALTSRNEGMPIAVLEAMAAGVPVVSTAVGGTVDVVSDSRTGLLVREQEPGPFAGRLIELLEDEALRRRLAEAARAHVRAAHSEERYVAATKDLYRECLKARRGRVRP